MRCRAPFLPSVPPRSLPPPPTALSPYSPFVRVAVDAGADVLLARALDVRIRHRRRSIFISARAIDLE